MIKKYNKAFYREKFHRYRLSFLIFAVVFVISLVCEILWMGDMNYVFHGKERVFSTFFSDLFTGELLVFLILFLFGVTLYAPVIAFLGSAARGAFSGFCFAVLLSNAENRSGVLLLLLTLFYLLLSAWLFLSYATFCTSTALQIYSDPGKRGGGDKRMYGGTLFYSSFNIGSVNLRFLFSYILFFLAALFLILLLSLGFSALHSLI